jgi:hypothetical protein
MNLLCATLFMALIAFSINPSHFENVLSKQPMDNIKVSDKGLVIENALAKEATGDMVRLAYNEATLSLKKKYSRP